MTVWIRKTTVTHSECVIMYSLLFHSNSGYMNAPHCYVIRTLPVWLLLCVNTHHKYIRGSGSMGGGRRLVDQPYKLPQPDYPVPTG